MKCTKCRNFKFGKCELSLPCPTDYKCFEPRILHIDNDGEYGDEMTDSQIRWMVGYCQRNKEMIMLNDYEGADLSWMISDIR